MACQHRSGVRHSVRGYYTCNDCFALVPHPWFTNKYPLKRDHIAEFGKMVPPTGIERMEKQEAELAASWPKRMGIEA